MTKPHTISPLQARRVAISRQRLAGPRPQADPAGIVEVARDLGCVQIDPINAVARTHFLVLWSRLGNYDTAHLDTVLWEERKLFEYWAHAASIVLTEDFPIHHYLMRLYLSGQSGWAERTRKWVEKNRDLHAHIRRRMEAEGPLLSRQLEDTSSADWQSTGWTRGRNVSQMLDYMWTMGEIMVAGRVGIQRLWDLSERCLPEWTPREALEPHEVTRRAAQKALRALGVARANDIKVHYTRSRYPHLDEVLRELESEGRIERVEIKDDGQVLPGTWYVHSEDVPLLASVMHDWQPRTTLLSPFDNLICDRQRTERLFNFNFRIEIYVPKHLRQYGYYVLPILHGDRLIGRIDPLMDRKHKRLNINAVYAEPDAPTGAGTAASVAGAIRELAGFLGAEEIAYTGKVPEGWKSALQ